MTPNQTNISFSQHLKRIIFFFPLQLLWVHLKKSHLLLFSWIFLFAILSENVLVKFGIPSLFLSPEYLGEVGFTSHFILGFALGGYITAYNIASYISNGFRFPFIATLANPFIKYSLNNFFFPLLFVSYYVYKLVTFQHYSELTSMGDISLNVLGFLLGTIIFIALALSYFLRTNKNIFSLGGGNAEHKSDPIPSNPIKGFFHKQEKWYNVFNPDREWRIETYFSSPIKIALARDSKHYNKEMLKKVFSQNHINASIFELLVIMSVIIIGSFHDIPYVMIPAGASILLMFTMVIMAVSALQSWFKGWSNAIILAFLILVNFISKNDRFNYTNFAYGLNYTGEKAVYNNDVLDSLSSDTKAALADFKTGVDILNNWKHKNQPKISEKPKLVIVATSGGGLRSSLWTYRSLQYIDSLLAGEFLPQVHLISGSSGGMLGAAYLREQYLQQQNGNGNINAKEHLNNISKDVLNPIAFIMAVSDPFFRYQSFDDGHYTYTKDRGYAFEQQINKNLNNSFTKRLYDYRAPEKEANIPLMIFAPVVANDGRQLLISSQDIAYMTSTSLKNNIRSAFLPQGVEFKKLLKNQDPDSLRFSSAIRMSATFPYVMVNASLPTTPTIEVMDAGVRDNNGLLVTMRYLYTFRNWINTNTSGVIVLQIKDKAKDVVIKDNPKKTIISHLKGPFGGFYGNWANMQTLNQEEIIFYSNSWFNELHVLDLELENTDNDYISLSWHLTNKEKQQVLNSIHAESNQNAINKLKTLVK